jgi:DNA-directed RNA polymerase subunit M/transcription elongation factor TFIIS
MSKDYDCPECQKNDMVQPWLREYSADYDTVEIHCTCCRCNIEFSVFFDAVEEEFE